MVKMVIPWSCHSCGRTMITIVGMTMVVRRYFGNLESVIQPVDVLTYIVTQVCGFESVVLKDCISKSSFAFVKLSFCMAQNTVTKCREVINSKLPLTLCAAEESLHLLYTDIIL